MGEFIYGKGYMGLFTEGFGNGDVVGVRNSGYIVEFEIKVTAQDLRNEIKSIQGALCGDMRLSYSRSKFYKHEKYLGKDMSKYGYVDTSYRPNLFYFVVPIELEKIAVDGVKGTPYGVLCQGNWTWTYHFTGFHRNGETEERPGYGFKESVKATLIHKEKISNEQMKRLVRKATTELYETRRRIK